MNWLINILQKEARRFNPDDYVRYFLQNRKGRGRGIVFTPSFNKGRIVDFDPAAKKYRVLDEQEQTEVYVHPRNLVPDSISRSQTTEVSNTPMESGGLLT